MIALVALIAVGPEQLPSVMRKFGGYVAQLRGMADSVRGEFMNGADQLDPGKWTGDGSDEKPIVPRGFADSATTTLGTPVVKPMASNPAIDKAFGKKPDPGLDADPDSAGGPSDAPASEVVEPAVVEPAVVEPAVVEPEQEPPAS